MEDKKENKTFIMVLIGIIGLCLITIGLTYAYWILTREQSGENVVNTACLNINFTGENDITLDKAYPMNNEQLEKFLSTATPYHFTIENTCDDLANATINLESLDADTEKQLNDEYIDAILYETDYHNNLNNQKQLGESMYNDENKVIKESLHAYELYNFVLQKGETKSFNLLLYMDANTPMEDANMNATWKGKITLSTSYKEELTANLNGLKVPVVENGDGLYAVSHDVSEISTDWNKTEYRYAGSNPNNYATFNNEIWRIIGLVNVKNGENVEQRLKIVRTDDIDGQNNMSDYSWDYSGSDKTNNWSKSRLKDMLNGIYYESQIGDCYKDTSEATECDFSTGAILPKGLNQTARNMIDKEVIWNIGSLGTTQITVNELYEKERTINIENEYPSEWSSITDEGDKHNGVGLIYSSDYIYASGSNIRSKCIETKINYFTYESCHINDWLKPGNGWLWTLTVYPGNYGYAWSIQNSGNLIDADVHNSRGVIPSVYLKSSVKITPNSHPEQEYGTIDNPFQLSVQ